MTAILDKVTDWTSIYIATILAFCSAIQFSLYFSSMWPFLETVDKDATEQFYGFVVAVFSVAACMAGPVIGKWSNKIKQITIPMFVGLTTMVVGNALYFSIEAFPGHRGYVMMVARFLMGLGSANIPLLKAYASTACLPEERGHVLGILNGGIALGITLGPGLQLLFTPFGYPGLNLFGKFSINMYTAPAYAACIADIVCILLLAFKFNESYAGIVEKKDEDGQEIARLPPFNKIAAAICNLTVFTRDFYFVNLESIAAPFALSVFAFTNQETVQYASIMNIALGIISTINFTAYVKLHFARFIRFRLAVMIALTLLLIFHLLSFPWPFFSGSLKTFSNQDLQNATSEVLGCNVDKFSWCLTMKPVNPWLYYIAFAICTGFAVPYIEICNSTVYGRILGPRRQGTMQGWMQFSGGVARIVGPMIVGLMYTEYGPAAIWINGIVVTAITIVLWIIFQSQMVELKVEKAELAEQGVKQDDSSKKC